MDCAVPLAQHRDKAELDKHGGFKCNCNPGHYSTWHRWNVTNPSVLEPMLPMQPGRQNRQPHHMKLLVRCHNGNRLYADGLDDDGDDDDGSLMAPLGYIHVQ